MVQVTRKDTPWRKVPSSRCRGQARRSRTTRCWPCCARGRDECWRRRSRPRWRRSSPPTPTSPMIRAAGVWCATGTPRSGPSRPASARSRSADRGGDGSGPVRFSSAVLPPYLRRARNIEELLPWLYLKGVSTGRFAEALAALLGPDAPGLSAATVRRLTEAWQEEHARWQKRDLSARRYVYLWADGVHFTPRLDHERQCLLVLIGADAQGRKERLAVEDGFRESARSWRELLLRLRDENGLALGPEPATGDGALGFWQALHEVWPKTRQQRCRVHEAANVPNKLPRSLQGKARQDLHAIYEAENRKEAEAALDRFVAEYGPKYDKAVACLAKDREALPAFCTVPAEHWKRVRTTDVLDKSLFAAVLGWPGTGDRVALSGAAAASPAGSPHVVDPAALAAPVRSLPGFGRHDATRCS